MAYPQAQKYEQRNVNYETQRGVVVVLRQGDGKFVLTMPPFAVASFPIAQMQPQQKHRSPAQRRTIAQTPTATMARYSSMVSPSP